MTNTMQSYIDNMDNFTANPSRVVDALQAGKHVYLQEIRDAKYGSDLAVDEHSRWEVYVRGGRVPTGIDAVRWATEAERRGAGELMLTSMDGDGTKEGFDVSLTRAVSNAVSIPVIASGGAGTAQHFAAALTEGAADAALAASIFHFGEFTITETKEAMAARGIPVRL